MAQTDRQRRAARQTDGAGLAGSANRARAAATRRARDRRATELLKQRETILQTLRSMHVERATRALSTGAVRGIETELRDIGRPVPMATIPRYVESMVRRWVP